MLVLTREIGEEVVILVGDVEIVIHHMESRRGQVRLGFDAPPEAIIHRREIYEDSKTNGTTLHDELQRRRDEKRMKS